jgi:hypothetical protein
LQLAVHGRLSYAGAGVEVGQALHESANQLLERPARAASHDALDRTASGAMYEMFTHALCASSTWGGTG